MKHQFVLIQVELSNFLWPALGNTWDIFGMKTLWNHQDYILAFLDTGIHQLIWVWVGLGLDNKHIFWMKEDNQIPAWSHCVSEYLQAGRWEHIVGNTFVIIVLILSAHSDLSIYLANFIWYSGLSGSVNSTIAGTQYTEWILRLTFPSCLHLHI